MIIMSLVFLGYGLDEVVVIAAALTLTLLRTVFIAFLEGQNVLPKDFAAFLAGKH